jgi:hypothetical protein
MDTGSSRGVNPNPVTGVITGDAGEESSSGRAIRLLTNREVYTINPLASSLDHPYVLNLPSTDQTISSFLFFTIHFGDVGSLNE